MGPAIGRFPHHVQHAVFGAVGQLDNGAGLGVQAQGLKVLADKGHARNTRGGGDLDDDVAVAHPGYGSHLAISHVQGVDDRAVDPLDNDVRGAALIDDIG